MPRWRASSLRSKPSAQRARRIGCVTKPRLTCSITSNASTMLTSTLDNRLQKPHGVRDAGGTSLGGCQPNRAQARSHCRPYPGSRLVFRILAAQFFLVPAQLRALPDCQSISALTDTETYFSDKRLLPI